MTKATSVFSALIFCLVLIFPVRWAIAQMSQTFLDCIKARESGNLGPSAKNDSGYTGLYQFGVNAAETAGLCGSPPPPKMNGQQDWNQCSFNGPLAQQYGIHNYSDFTTGPNAAAVQNAMMQNLSASNWKTIQNMGLDKYEGQIVNGVLMTKETMLAMAHLLGVGGPSSKKGLWNFLNGTDGKDGNGTSGSSYASCVGQCMTGNGGDCHFDAKTICSGAGV